MIGASIPIWHALIGLITGGFWGAKNGSWGKRSLLCMAGVAGSYALLGWLGLQQVGGEAAPGSFILVWLLIRAYLTLLAGYWIGLNIEKN